MKNNDDNEQINTATIAALASISKTPFKTAFKAYMGIIAAQTLGFILFALIICVVIYLLKG